MPVLDEQLLGRNLETALGRWYRGAVLFIIDLRPGTVIKDDAISEGVMKQLQITDQRVVGEIEDREQRESLFSDMSVLTYAASFSAPVFHEPKVTEDLKGQAAKNSPQVKVLRAAAEALKKADFEALRKISTERANRQTDAMLVQGGAQVANFARQAGKGMAQSIEKVQRIVVRGNRAVVIFPAKAWRNLERVGGEWKIDE
jgi:hypothetical protein